MILKKKNLQWVLKVIQTLVITQIKKQEKVYIRNNK